MSIQVVESYETFIQLESRWAAIADAGGVQTPYQSFAWLDQWLRHLGNGVEPFVLVIHNGATIAPFGRFRIAGVTVLRLLGTGDSDYLGLVTASQPEEAWDSVGQELAKRRSAWDLLHLHSVRNRGAIIKALERHVGSGGRERPYEVCPRIPTDRSWEDLLESREKKLRYEIRRWARRLQDLGELSVEVAQAPVPEEVISELEVVERASWKWQSGEAAFRPGRKRDFLAAILRDPRVNLQLWLLRVSAQLVAFALVLVAQKQWYYYLPTFRQDYPHAGSYLLASIVQEACASECACVDLLRGPHTYKCVWTDLADTVYEIVHPSRVMGRAAALAYATRWRAAQVGLLRSIRSRIWRVGDRR